MQLLQFIFIKFKLTWESDCCDIKWGENRKHNLSYISKRETDMGL